MTVVCVLAAESLRFVPNNPRNVEAILGRKRWDALIVTLPHKNANLHLGREVSPLFEVLLTFHVTVPTSYSRGHFHGSRLSVIHGWEQPEMRFGKGGNVYGNALSRWVPGTTCISHDGSYEHYFKIRSLLKITVFREVPPCSLESKNRRSNGRMKTEAAGVSETSILMHIALHPIRQYYVTQ